MGQAGAAEEGEGVIGSVTIDAERKPGGFGCYRYVCENGVPVLAYFEPIEMLYDPKTMKPLKIKYKRKQK